MACCCGSGDARALQLNGDGERDCDGSHRPGCTSPPASHPDLRGAGESESCRRAGGELELRLRCRARFAGDRDRDTELDRDCDRRRCGGDVEGLRALRRARRAGERERDIDRDTELDRERERERDRLRRDADEEGLRLRRRARRPGELDRDRELERERELDLLRLEDGERRLRRRRLLCEPGVGDADWHRCESLLPSLLDLTLFGLISCLCVGSSPSLGDSACKRPGTPWPGKLRPRAAGDGCAAPMPARGGCVRMPAGLACSRHGCGGGDWGVGSWMCSERCEE